LRQVFAVLGLLLPMWAAAQETVSDQPARSKRFRPAPTRSATRFSSRGGAAGDPFTKGLVAGGGYTFHFTDHFAWNVAHGGYVYNVTTSLQDQLVRDFGAPAGTFEKAEFFAGTDLVFKPFYGKSSVVNTYVVHFDTQIWSAPTSGNSRSGLRPVGKLRRGVRVFQNHVMSWRIDLTDDVVIFTKKAPMNVPSSPYRCRSTSGDGVT